MWRQSAISAGHHDDAVLSRIVYKNPGRASRVRKIDTDMRNVDAFDLQMSQVFLAEGVAADASDETGASAEAGGGDRLIRAFAPERKVELPPRQGLAHARQMGGAKGQVHVGRANHADTR